MLPPPSSHSDALPLVDAGTVASAIDKLLKVARKDHSDPVDVPLWLGEPQAQAIAEALRAIARKFDSAERRAVVEQPAHPCVELCLGEQECVAAIAALRSTLERCVSPSRIGQLPEVALLRPG